MSGPAQPLESNRDHSPVPVAHPVPPRLRVALPAPYPMDPTRIPGGVRSVVFNLAQGLRTMNDLDVHVIHCHSEVTRKRESSDDGLTFHFRPMSRQRLLPNTVMAIGRVRDILRQVAPDVANPHSGHYALASLRANLPTVYTVHGVPAREAPSYAHKGLGERLRYWMETYYSKLAVRSVHHAIAISPYVLREYEGQTRAQWYRIDNPLPDEYFAVEDQSLPGQILYVGTITEVKDILTLLRAFKELISRRAPDATAPLTLRLAGRTTSPAYEESIKSYIANNALQQQVSLLGMLDRAALLQEYSRCTLVALSSRQENAPMAIIEAMAAGKPVVATRVGGIPDLVQEGQTGYLVEAGDAVGLASRMGQLIDQPKTRVAMGRLARQQASSRFRTSDVADKYREVYRAVAQADRRGLG